MKKKLLVVLLAMVMVLAFATSAYAFTDTDSLSTTQQDAIYRLSALEVLNGYPDGTFGAGNQITRAEFAKIACIAAGFTQVSDVMKNTPSAFSDVAVGMWYTGYVNIATSQGYINGYPDGTFKPNKTISMAEVVTILLRIAGYDDNLPGPWPFDYIAKAGKLDVTDDVTFVSNVPATRGDVAVMVNNLLDLELVNWDSDTTSFVEADEDPDKDNTVLMDSFDASIFSDAIFNNVLYVPDQLDGWEYSDFKDREVTLDTSEGDYVLNADCYVSGGHALTDLGGMVADIIVNEDDEAIYIKVTSHVVYTDDISGTIQDDNLEIDGDSVDVVDVEIDGTDCDTFAPWYSYVDDKNTPDTADDILYINFDNYEYDYAKVFFNSDDEAYAVDDLADELTYSKEACDVAIADSWDADDETLSLLNSTTEKSKLDLDGEDYVVFKDGEEIKASDIKQLDVVYVFNTGDYYVLLVEALAEGKLTEGSDKGVVTGSITVAEKKYKFNLKDKEYFATYLNVEGGVDGSFDLMTSVGQLDDADAFDTNVLLAMYLNPYAVADVIADTSGASSIVCGIVTDITVGGLFHSVTDVTILNQEGKEVTYDLDDDDILSYYDESDAEDSPQDTDVELGCYVEVELDEDGVITAVCEDDHDNLLIFLADDYDYDYSDSDGIPDTSDDPMNVSSGKIQIGGSWYKITDDTLFFEAVYDGDFDSRFFDEANLIDVADIKDADEVAAYVTIIDGGSGTLEKLYLINSSINDGKEGYSFVDRLYTNSNGNFVEMMDGTVAERDNSFDYDPDTFYSYNIVDGVLETTKIFATGDSYSSGVHNGSPVEDGFWVLGFDGTLASDTVNDYALGEFICLLSDYGHDTMTIGDHYYTISDNTKIYTVEDDGYVDKGDEDDIEDADYVGVISDDHGNALYVFVLPMTII